MKSAHFNAYKTSSSSVWVFHGAARFRDSSSQCTSRAHLLEMGSSYLDGSRPRPKSQIWNWVLCSRAQGQTGGELTPSLIHLPSRRARSLARSASNANKAGQTKTCSHVSRSALTPRITRVVLDEVFQCV